MELTMISDRALEIFDALKTSRDTILTLSNEIAQLELLAKDRKGDLDFEHAEAFVEAATELNPETGKLTNPNIDAQKAAMCIKLNKSEGYGCDRVQHAELLRDIQLKKNTIIYEHERRGDLRTEADFLKSCVKAEVDSCGSCK